MNTDQQFEPILHLRSAGAVADLKARLQHDYEEAYPQLAEIIHLVIDEEEANARELSFPQLFLPDLVAAHIEKLNLEPVGASYGDGLARRAATAASITHARTAHFSTPDRQLRAA